MVGRVAEYWLGSVHVLFGATLVEGLRGALGAQLDAVCERLALVVQQEVGADSAEHEGDGDAGDDVRAAGDGEPETDDDAEGRGEHQQAQRRVDDELPHLHNTTQSPPGWDRGSTLVACSRSCSSSRCSPWRRTT